MNKTIIASVLGLGSVLAFALFMTAAAVQDMHNKEKPPLQEVSATDDPTSWISGCVTSTSTGETMFLLRGHEVGVLAPGEDCIKGMERMFWEEYRSVHK